MFFYKKNNGGAFVDIDGPLQDPVQRVGFRSPWGFSDHRTTFWKSLPGAMFPVDFVGGLIYLHIQQMLKQKKTAMTLNGSNWRKKLK